MKTTHHIFIAIGLILFGLCVPLSFVKATNCAVAQSGNVTLTESCTFGGTYDGAADGNIVVGANVTLTVLAGQVVNVSQGYNYTVTASGAKIVIIDTGVIQVGASIICLTDADGDTYAASLDPATQTFATGSCGTGKIARKNAQTQVDCNDSNASYFAALTCYADADGDTVYSNTSGSVCGGATCAGVGQSATAGTDCCDTDANAKPGQTAYFSTARTTCGGFDYNCDGAESGTDDSIFAGCSTCSPNVGTQSCDAVCSGTCGTGWEGLPSCGVQGSYRLGGGCAEGAVYSSCTAANCGSTLKVRTCR